MGGDGGPRLSDKGRQAHRGQVHRGLQPIGLNERWESQTTREREKQECIPVGCVPPACCPYLKVCSAPMVGVPGPGGVPVGGVYLPGEACLVPGGRLVLGGAWWRPPVNRMTNRCKNIILPQTSFAAGNKTKLLWCKHRPRDGLWRGRYASYWNAFFFEPATSNERDQDAYIESNSMTLPSI